MLRSGESGPEFNHFAKDIHIRKSGKDLYKAVLWLIGKVTYSDMFGKMHLTRFCFRGRSDGFAQEDGEPPYNERT